MTSSERWVWAFLIVVVDVFMIVVPVTALALAYVLVARPVWFKDWVSKVYA